MTSKPEPDKLGRNMKALPSNCQKLADGIQQSWNRAIPENDYIQLGTLRYGVRLSNTGLLESPKAGHVETAGNSRASLNSSYELTNGGSSAPSVGGTGSISSSGEQQQNCCCIGSGGGVELPWTNSFSRQTKLPVPSSLAKNRKPSPIASSGVNCGGGGGGSPGAAVLRYPPSTPGHGNGNGYCASQFPLAHGHGSDNDDDDDDDDDHDEGRPISGPAGYSNGSVSHSSNSNGSSVHYGNSNGSAWRKPDSPPLDQGIAKQDQEPGNQESSPRCSAVVCCYSHSFKGREATSPERTPSGRSVRLRQQQQQQRRDRQQALEQIGAGGGGGGGGGAGGGVSPQRDHSAPVVLDGAGGHQRPDGDDLNLNSRNTPRQLYQVTQYQQQQQQQRWQGGVKDANINNFERRKAASDSRAGGGSDSCANDELSSASSLSPRSNSPSAIGWGAPGPDPVSPAQLHPPQLATPFRQRRRVLQPPSSLPVVKSFSFHRVTGPDSPQHRSPSAGQLFESVAASAEFAGRNRSFRSAHHARRLQYGREGDVEERANGTLLGVEVQPRKSSLPVLGSNGGSGAGRYYPVAALSPAPVSSRSSIDECYPFDKSSCQPECLLTPRSHRRLPCSDALNEIRLQSLSKYCNQLLGAAANHSGTVPGRYRRASAAGRPIDELEDLSFIDSSDLSSAGDDGAIGVGRSYENKRARRPQQSSIIASSERLAAAVGGGGTVPVVDTARSKTVPLGGDDGGTRSVAAASDGRANRNNHIDSSSDELNSGGVCSSVEQVANARACAASGGRVVAEALRSNGHQQQQQQQQQQQAATVKCRVQCDRNVSNASDAYQVTRYGEQQRLLDSPADVDGDWDAVYGADGGLRSHGSLISRLSDTNNNKRRTLHGDGEGGGSSSISERHQHQQQQQQQQQKYTTLPSNNSAVKSVSVGGGGGGGGGLPGRPGVGVGEQTLPSVGRAATADESCCRSPVAAALAQPDGSPAAHAGLSCFGRSATQLHAAGGSTADKSIMEKRSNTLDRLQRLVKKTTSGSSEKQLNQSGPSGGPAAAGAGGSKTERLRELTELLKGNRASPPVPPPRRPKHAHSVDRTFERGHSAALSTTSLISIDAERDADGPLPKAKESRSVDIPYRFADGPGQRMSTPSSPLAEHKPMNLRANASTSNLVEGLHERPPATPLKDDDGELFAKLSRPESRTIVGAYTQKTIPFRSASFSQVDYSSGKYIRSALGALKNSLLKGKEQLPSGDSKVEAARSCSPTELRGSPPRPSDAPNAEDTVDTEVAKLMIKKTELSINLAPPDDYSMGMRLFDERLERPDAKELPSNRNSDIETIVEDPVAEHAENVENVAGSEPPASPPAPPPPPPPPPPPLQASISVMEASEMVLESPVEEGIPITPGALAKDDECLQQATTCLIPVPVYDCVVSEWSTARPSEQWIDASTTEYGARYPDALDSIKEDNEAGTEAPERPVVIERPPRVIEPQSSGEQLSEEGTGSDAADQSDERGFCTPPVSIICTEPESNESTMIVDGTHRVAVVLGSGSEVEVVEVRKRHSNNNDSGDAGDTPTSRLSNDVDEKRRLESRKSRRKGIYIQWPAIDGNSELESDAAEGGSTPALGEADVRWGGPVPEKDSSLDLSGDSCTDLSGREPVDHQRDGAVRSPDRYLLDPTTPDSDTGRPVWPRGSAGDGVAGRRQSLTYQSSDEKDDTLPVPPPAAVRSLKTLFLRSDSVSDNESERASSRDRTSASPAPGGEVDLKRYSKRPLRGPYGQMLEAEMKKPTTKVQYNEILEELTGKEGGGHVGTGRHRVGAGSQSMDETNDRHSGKACKPRKTSANLPVPTHVRTSSSPSKLSDSSGSHSASPGRRPGLSQLEQRSTDSEKSDGRGKKLSLDSHLPDRSKPSKRSASSASDKQQKRSLDEPVRLSQHSRTPSERSFTLGAPSDTPKAGGLGASPELLAELLKGSSEKLITEQLTGGSGSTALPSAVLNCLDTRTHVVVELFNTEKSYVESLQTIVLKYLNQLKSPENSGLVDAQTVDEIFFMVPAILNIHERFLEELRRRLDSWDKLQMIGDAFVDVFSRPVILETYTSFVNNWNRAKDAIRGARQKCPAFARFLEAMAREHKGKLSLDNLLIKPVQKFPNYELIFTRLIKHTDVAHPDQKPLQEALKLVHDILIFLNCKEKEALENGQRETALRELEGVIEGMSDLVAPERAFLLFDLVSMPSGQVTRKERGFFLFNDLLVITSIKRRSGTIRKTNMTCPGSVASTLDTNKYKYLTKISLDDLEIVKSKDENVRRIMREIEHLTEDSGKLIQLSDIAASLRCPHASLEESIREVQREIQRQLAERQTNDAQLNVLELTWNTASGIQNMTVVFSKPEKRTQWEETFAEAKQKLANSLERSQIPEFFVSVPIRKTRAGLQFTCASPTLGSQKDVWVCNSDGYVGQVCVLSLVPEPSVTSCNGVCNARILCVSSVPASEERPTSSSAVMNVNIAIIDAASGGGGTPNNRSNSATVNSSPAKTSERKGSFKSTEGRQTVHGDSNVQLDSGSSSEDSEAESQPERGAPSPSGAPSLTPNHRQQDSVGGAGGVGVDLEPDNQQSTMWLGTEDGCIHVYNCTDNIRIKKNKIKIPHVSAVYSILYLDNRVFVSLANGDICVYSRDRAGWNVSSPLTVSVGTVTNPVVKLLNVHGKLWCAIQGMIKVLNTKSLQIDSQIQISNDSKPITNMTVLNEYVWISVQNSAHIKCCHHESFEVIFEVNLAPSVNKMLSNCDDIIRQHKAACLRVTSLLACRDLIWVGTSAGVLLTIAAQSIAKGSPLPVVTGIPHGHTGHVRFLTFVESPQVSEDGERDAASASGTGGKPKPASQQELLVISGGDGYEDFRSAGNNTMSEVAGREDSTNHLLLWKV